MSVTALLLSWTLDSGARIPAVRRSSSSIPSSTYSSPASVLALPHIEEFCNAAGLSERHLLNVYRHLFRRGGELSAAALRSEAEMPKAAAEALCEHFVIVTSTVVKRVPSEGGVKLVVELASGHHVETVLILHDHRSSGRSRCTVCVSSQVGCARAW